MANTVQGPVSVQENTTYAAVSKGQLGLHYAAIFNLQPGDTVRLYVRQGNMGDCNGRAWSNRRVTDRGPFSFRMPEVAEIDEAGRGVRFSGVMIEYESPEGVASAARKRKDRLGALKELQKKYRNSDCVYKGNGPRNR